MFAAEPLDGREVHLEAVARLQLGQALQVALRSHRMAENVRRDRALVPELDAVMRNTGDARMTALTKALGGGPLVALALDFWTWRRLAEEGLGDAQAAALMARAATID